MTALAYLQNRRLDLRNFWNEGTEEHTKYQLLSRHFIQLLATVLFVCFVFLLVVLNGVPPNPRCLYGNEGVPGNLPGHHKNACTATWPPPLAVVFTD
jgi:hypothetical protein